MTETAPKTKPAPPALTSAEFKERLTSSDVKYTQPKSVYYLSRAQVAELIGVKIGTLNRYKLPPHDAQIGVRQIGWLEETIVAWQASRTAPRKAPRDITK